jgi:hypothetical protein
MRITIEIPDDVLSSTRTPTPSVTSELSALASEGEALPGGEASLEIGGVAVSLDEASSAGLAEQGGEITPAVADEDINEGGPAPS